LGRFTLLHDVSKMTTINFDWLSLKNVGMSSPKADAINVWVKELAVMQVMVYRDIFSTGSIFYQTDGGHAGQEVSLLSKYCEKEEKVIQVWAGLTSVGGKGSSQVAQSTKKRIELFCGGPISKIDGLCVDSGCGTPESLGAELQKLDLTSSFFTPDSCGLHDIQSVFRYSVLNCIGGGSLDQDNAIQLLHTMFSFYNENKSYWKSLVGKTVEKLDDLDYDISNLPHDLNCSMQAPLITWWWSISSLANVFTIDT